MHTINLDHNLLSATAVCTGHEHTTQFLTTWVLHLQAGAVLCGVMGQWVTSYSMTTNSFPWADGSCLFIFTYVQVHKLV